MSRYSDIIDIVFNKIPQFQRVGAMAYKSGLEDMNKMLRVLGNPHMGIHYVHVAGTNGKGSVSNLIAAALQVSGLKVGLYTSPHLVDFRERIRVDGECISEDSVVSFYDSHSDIINQFNPSFFEFTTLLAFDYFNKMKVDVAVMEVGLGGRLDSTNVITPQLSVITNISKDHTQFLGNTLGEIAAEKAGIIKNDVPVVIGESNAEYNNVFIDKAKQCDSPIVFADDKVRLQPCQLRGIYQKKNINTALAAIEILNKQGYNISDSNIDSAFMSVCDITGFMGRWMQLNLNPLIVCDAGHNQAGVASVVEQLSQEKYNRLHMVIGFVADKDIDTIINILPEDAVYYFAQASIPRALNSGELRKKALQNNLKGDNYESVAAAYCAALRNASPDDMIFVGGSCFVVADLLSYLKISQ